MGKCVPLEQQQGFKPEAAKVEPVKAGAWHEQSGRRAGGVETIAGGNQDTPANAVREKKPGKDKE